MTTQEAQLLIDSYLDDALDGVGMEQLSAWITADPVHANSVVLAAFLDRRLHDSHSAERTLQEYSRALQASSSLAVSANKTRSWDQGQTSVHREPSAHFSAWRIAAVLVIMASAVFALTSPLWMGWKKAAPLATLADAVDAQWDMPQQLDVGDGLPSGPVVLKAGYVHIALSNGVNLVLKGPAHFSVDSLMRVQLDVGKLTADVPHTAIGFTVKTSRASVTDLGTTFGVTAFANGEGEVQVLKGKVQAKLLDDHGATKVETELTEDHAAEFHPTTGMLTSIPMTPDAYVTNIHHIPAPETPYARWLEYSNQLRKDPSLLAYYTFDNQAQAPRRLLNRAVVTAGQHDGQIKNAAWDEGRFPGKQALRFNGKNSRVKINLPEQSNQVTLAMWVRLDSMAHNYMGLLMSDDWSIQGEIAWQIHSMQPLIAVFKPVVGGFQVDPPVSVDAVGQWVLLVATVDAQTSTVMLYRNGVIQAAGKVANAVPMSLGAAQIGGWDPVTIRDHGDATSRTLDGRIDEVAVFSRILSNAEIQGMYQAGRNE